MLMWKIVKKSTKSQWFLSYIHTICMYVCMYVYNYMGIN